MRFDFIFAQKANHAVKLLCRVLRVSRSGFYTWCERPEAKRAGRDRQLTAKIRTLHAESKRRYGSPRIHRDLVAAGEAVSRKRVARLMRQQALAGRHKRRLKKTTDSAHSLPVATNVVARNFRPSALNKIWVADITYVRTWEGWLYLAVVIDLFSRRVIGFAMADHMRTELVLEALGKAVILRQPPSGLVHHSDRGSQYASDAHRTFLADHGIIASMSRKGNCWDNAVAESFFATLKEELIYRGAWPTKAQAKEAIDEYITRFYNLRRRHSTLGYATPVQYEIEARQQLLAA